MSHRFIIIFGSLALACGDKDTETGEGSASLDGAALYTANCTSCHGADGDGNSAVLSEVVPTLSDSELEDVIVNGTDSGMTSGLVTDSGEITAIVDYLRETWGG